MLTVFKFIKNYLKIDVSRHKHFSNVKYGIVFATIYWRWGSSAPYLQKTY